MRTTIAAMVLLLASASPVASGKGVEFSLSVDRPSPVAREQVRITLVGTSTIPGEPAPACAGMRIVAVAPGISVKRALRSLEGGVRSRRIGRWGAFRLASLRQVDDLTWTARLRPGTVGRWTLVVPNWCAAGYVLPTGVTRRQISVGAP